MTKRTRTPVVLAPGEGRNYAMGPVTAVFKADAEVRERFCVSEWWLEPRTRGPGAHVHPLGEDDLFYVLEGTLSIFLGDHWFEAPVGTFVLAPGGIPHDFENRTGRRAGMLNIAFPGGFEQNMPGIAEWFRARPAAEARTAVQGRPAGQKKKTAGKEKTVSKKKVSKSPSRKK